MLLYGRMQMLPQFSYQDAVKFLMDSGFDGVEISVFDKQFRPRAEFFEEDFVPSMLETMKRCGVKGFSVSAHMDFTESEHNYDIVERTIRVAAKLGAPYCIINGAIRHEELAFEAQWDAMREKITALAKLAEDLGIKLAEEFEPGFVWGDTKTMLRGMAEVNSPALGVNCDIGHVFLCDEDPMEAIELVKPYILQCHVENMAKGVHNHLVPWEGDMDLPAYIAKLKEIGFDGGLGLDLYQYEYADVCAKSAAYLRALL